MAWKNTTHRTKEEAVKERGWPKLDKINTYHCVTIQGKAIEEYFPVVLFIMLYKVVLTFESVDKTLKCDHSSESC